MSPTIDETAIRWAVRIDAETLDGSERDELDAWLRQDARHRGALLRARAGLALIDEGGPGAVPETADEPTAAPATTPVPIPSPVPLFTPRRRIAAFGAIAACAVGLMTIGWVALSGESYRTGVGEIRRVVLADGSVAMINTDSDVEVDYAKTQRNIRVDTGEAWFQVAKDRTKPFVVDVDGIHVRATGTAFSVRRMEDAVEVVVTEGHVVAWNARTGGKQVPIAAGQAAIIAIRPDAPAPRVAAVGNDDPLAWRQGGLALNETQVSAAAAEFNRYNRTRIEVESRRVGDRRMTGYFQIDKPGEFADAVAAITGAQVTQNGNIIVIK